MAKASLETIRIIPTKNASDNMRRTKNAIETLNPKSSNISTPFDFVFYFLFAQKSFAR